MRRDRVIDWDKTRLVESSCLGWKTAMRLHIRAYMIEVPEIKKHLAIAAPEATFIVSARIHEHWFCQRVEARVTDVSNVRD